METARSAYRRVNERSRVPGYMLTYPELKFEGPWVRGYPERKWVGVKAWRRMTRRR